MTGRREAAHFMEVFVGQQKLEYTLNRRMWADRDFGAESSQTVCDINKGFLVIEYEFSSLLESILISLCLIYIR